MGSSKYNKEEGEVRVSKVKRDDSKRSRDDDRRRSHRKHDSSVIIEVIRVFKVKDDDSRRSHRRKHDRDHNYYEDRHRKKDKIDEGRRDKVEDRSRIRDEDRGDGRKLNDMGEEVKKLEEAVEGGRSGGAYVPPFKLARMMRDVEDKSSPGYQRLTWNALRRSINGLVNKVNAMNIKNIIPELFAENLIRGRGLFCRSCMKSQMASPGFTDVFAALCAVVNTKFPDVGHLLLRRVVLQWKRAYKRNDKPQLLAATKFIAHLVNQQVAAGELIALELPTVLLEKPTDESVEVAVGFVTECGAFLQDFTPEGLHVMFDVFRRILNDGVIDKRVQFLIEGLFAIRTAKFQGHPAVPPELDLVNQADQYTHELSLDEVVDPETSLDIFKVDPQFLENEKRYENLKREILGDESSGEEDGSDIASDGEDDESDKEDEDEEQMKIQDAT